MMKIVKTDFIAKRVRCDGELLLPHNANKPPVVIMAHGMGAQKDFKLQDFASRFIDENVAAFLFDYRTFGKSDGEPRQLVDPIHHVEDWHAAIAHIRTLKEIDANRIALWGSSFSGGHVIMCAAKDHDIAAVVSQIPFVSGLSSLRQKKIPDIILASIFGIYDMIRASLFLPPHYSRLVSHPGSFAAMNTAESYDGYMSIVPKHSKWENKMQSRGFLKLSMYNPLKNAAKVKAPTLVMAGRNDSLIPIDAVKKLSEKLPKSELVIVECNHFQPYQGEFFYEFAEKQAAFFRKHLL